MSAITAAIAGAIVFFKSDAGSLSALLDENGGDRRGLARSRCRSGWSTKCPRPATTSGEALADWFRDHAVEVQTIGKEAGRALLYALFGMVIGAMIALHEALSTEPRGPLATELIERIDTLGDAFRRVVFAQVRISLLNTLFTAIYLVVVLPLFGVDLPFRKRSSS